MRKENKVQIAIHCVVPNEEYLQKLGRITDACQIAAREMFGDDVIFYCNVDIQDE